MDGVRPPVNRRVRQQVARLELSRRRISGQDRAGEAAVPDEGLEPRGVRAARPRPVRDRRRVFHCGQIGEHARDERMVQRGIRGEREVVEMPDLDRGQDESIEELVAAIDDVHPPRAKRHRTRAQPFEPALPAQIDDDRDCGGGALAEGGQRGGAAVAARVREDDPSVGRRRFRAAH